jgi:hypothetical protein
MGAGDRQIQRAANARGGALNATAFLGRPLWRSTSAWWSTATLLATMM